MSLETDVESVMELDREQYVPDWIVEGVVRLALRTGYREPILAAVGGVEGVDIDDDLVGNDGAGATDGGEGDVIEVEATDELEGEDASSGRRRGLVALLIVGVAAAVAYRFLADRP